MTDLTLGVLVGIVVGVPLGAAAWELIVEPFVVPRLAHWLRVAAVVIARFRAGHVGRQ
jgi:hypothetical protein